MSCGGEGSADQPRRLVTRVTPRPKFFSVSAPRKDILVTPVTANSFARYEGGSTRRPGLGRSPMDVVTLVINVAVPVGTVLLALIVYAPLSALFWRQFLKL